MAIGNSNNSNDTPLGVPEYRIFAPAGDFPEDGELMAWSDARQAFVPTPGVATNGFTITDDAGSGDVASDCNATDFTGQSPIVGTAADLPESSITTFVHDDIAYNWVGPTGVTVGVGGTHVAVTADFVGIGTADHAILTNLAVGDPHTQYVLKVDGLAVWVAAGYGGVRQDSAVGIPDIGGIEQILPADSASLPTPRAVTQNFANDGVNILSQGIWQFAISFSLLHNEVNNSRTMVVELFDVTDATVVSATTLPVARNQGGANYAATLMADVPQAAEGDLFVMRLSSPDAFTAVTLVTYTFNVNHISEAQGL